MSKEEQSEEQVFRSFLEVLSSNAPIAIPLDTLFGAITHFLSTLEGDSLNKLISAVLTSTSLWNISDANQKILQAPRLAVSTKVDTIDKALGKAYFSVYRKNKVARQWLGRIAQPIISAELSLPRTVIMRGLVQGLSDNQQIVWGRSRARLEEELVIECATTVDNLEGIELLCTTIVCVDENRLKALDLEDILSRLRNNVHRVLSSHGEAEMGEQLARALGRILIVMDHGGSSTRVYAWEAMKEFCQQYRGNDHNEKQGPEDLNALNCFIITASSIIDILTTSQPPNLPSSSTEILHPSACIAIEILITLTSFAEKTKEAPPVSEDYYKVLYGVLDVLETYGGVVGVNNLFDKLKTGRGERTSPGRVGVILTLGQQLIHSIDGRVLRDILYPLAHRYVREPTYQSTFESAHAMMISIIQASTSTFEIADNHRAFLEEIIPSYAKLLLRLTRDGDIKQDQLLSAYPVITGAGTKTSSNCLLQCQDLLHRALERAASPDIDQSFRLTSIAITPHVSYNELPTYLETIKNIILDTEEMSSQRSALSEAAFKMVVNGLPDESKRTGMEWWLRWRVIIEGRGAEQETVPVLRAKL